MEKSINERKMGRQCNHEDLDALVGYIQELELSLAKKDSLLASKDQIIDKLEAEVFKVTSAVPVFRARATDEGAATPRLFHDEINHRPHSTPNQISDESGEVEPGSEGSLSNSLSHISQAHSSDEDSALVHSAKDGRWNIPFDGSFEDLVAKSPSGKRMGHENALKEIGFIPISKEGYERFPSEAEATPVRPEARSARKVLLKGSAREKENVSPKRRSSVSPGIGALRDIR